MGNNGINAFSIGTSIRVGYKDTSPGAVATGGISSDLTKYLYSLPTLNVFGTSQQPNVTVSLAGVQCLNFIGGVRLATLQSATILGGVNSPFVFINTGGTFPVSLQLDNGGLVAGQSIFPLNSGVAVQLVWDGTNLHT